MGLLRASMHAPSVALRLTFKTQYVPLWMTRFLLCCRYFTEEAATLGCMIFGVRDSVGPGQVPMRDYWIPDGLYGSMNSLLYDHAVLSTHPLGATPKFPTP